LRRLVTPQHVTVHIGSSIIAATVAIAWLAKIPHYHARVLAAFLLVLTAILLVAIWAHRGALILSYLCVAITGVVLFSFELPIIGETRRSHWSASPMDWGDDDTFEYLFRKAEPFIGPGGRLRPSVRGRIASPAADLLGVSFETNRQGFRNREDFPFTPSPDEFRILILGDSFACGDGVGQDAFFGSVIERLLRRQFRSQKISVLNAEVSDPAYGLYYLQHYGTKYHPQVVVYGLFGGNDLYQTLIASGHEHSVFRLDENGSLRANPAFDPAFTERLLVDLDSNYAYPIAGNAAPAKTSIGNQQEVSVPFLIRDLLGFRGIVYLKRLTSRGAQSDARSLEGELPPSYRSVREIEWADNRKRLMDPTSSLGLFYRRPLEPVELMYKSFFPVLKAMESTTRASGATFVLAYFPQRYQVQPQDWKALRARWNLRDVEFDLDQQNDRIGRFCKDNQLNFCDLTFRFRQVATAFGCYFGKRSGREEMTSRLDVAMPKLNRSGAIWGFTRRFMRFIDFIRFNFPRKAANSACFQRCVKSDSRRVHNS
jgi:hypothetical protein